METVLADLRQCWPAVGYRILDSQYFGVPQRRRRLFLVGGPSELGVAQVLALFEGSHGHPPTRSETRPDLAATLVGGIAGTRSHGKPSGSDRRELVTPDVAYALAARVRGTGDQHGNAWNSTYVTHALMGDQGFDASENGTGRGVPLVAAGMHAPAVASRAAIRRLTPLECERLQGFPDGFTCLCLPLTAYANDPDTAALLCRCPDSPRYRALGNAVTVPVIAWLGSRLAAQL